MKQLVRPTSSHGGLPSQPSLQSQPTTSITTLRPIHMPTSSIVAALPLIHPSTIRFGPFQPFSTTTGSDPTCQPLSVVRTSQVNPSTIGSNPPCQPSFVVGTSQVNPSTRSVPLDNQSHSAIIEVARGKGYVGGKQKRPSVSQNTKSSRSSWKNNIQFDAKEEVLTVDDQGNE
ncbi:hypothetical protein Cgig2_009110 [Carnegiea gigantea]|uniref:Uncharacterized protein n=1 Tax=Carnegiea gigantea TaxID=171969 RepID=A0A9Q1JIX9_9CARY|nr:hypothetical protein Cgig2_009110 [Carnegiea gigantea]